jgi:Permuted papain-like amidase enzyme, YaeF/YiiX, C92 family
MWPLLFTLISSSYASCPLKDGDVVFIKSQTEQSRLLKSTTGSDWSHVGMAFQNQGHWDIIEAVQPVRWTDLLSFIMRSRDGKFEVKRATFKFDAEVVRAYAEDKLGLDYDLIFGWDSERWYCSELVWKAYEKASGVHLGELEKIGSLKVDHPQVLSETKKRFERYGLEFDLKAWKNYQVITPIQMKNSLHLNRVFNQRTSNLDDCFQ